MPRPRPDQGPLKTISIQLDPRDVERIDRAARKAGVSRGAFVRNMMRRYLDGVFC